jgi:hypothetical protein
MCVWLAIRLQFLCNGNSQPVQVDVSEQMDLGDYSKSCWPRRRQKSLAEDIQLCDAFVIVLGCWAVPKFRIEPIGNRRERFGFISAESNIDVEWQRIVVAMLGDFVGGTFEMA